MKKIIVIVLAIFFLFFLLSFFQKPLKVAACPTFYYMLEKLEKQGIETIPTNSTAESLQLLEKEKIDLAISGRNLRAGEPDFLVERIGPGYNFLFQFETAISEKDMKNLDFYTNASLQGVKNDFPQINSLEKKENIINYLNQGIVISQEDIEGEMVHVFKSDGSRIRLSRIPRIYFLEENKMEKVKNIIKE